MEMIWRAFKFLLSLVCLFVAAILTLFALKAPDSFAAFGVASVFLFFAAVLWIDVTKPSRALGLAGLVVTLGILVLAFSTATGHQIYPRKCTGRGWMLCELQNQLYFVGGYPAAAIPWFLFACAAFYGSIIVFNRVRTV